MGTESGTASMGATVFFGLTIMALATQGEVEITYANPIQTMGRATFQDADDVPVKEVVFEMPEASRFSDAGLDLAIGPLLARETELDTRVAALAPPRVRPQVLTDAQVMTEVTAPERALTVPRALTRRDLSITAPQPLRASAQDTWADTRENSWPALVTGDFVHLRDAPSGSGNIIARFDTGTQAQVFEERGDWMRIEIDGQVGWMFSGYLTRE